MKKTLFITLLLLSTALVCNAEEQQPQIQPLAFNLSVEENVTPDYSTTYYRRSIRLQTMAAVEGNRKLGKVTFKNKDGKFTIERENSCFVK